MELQLKLSKYTDNEAVFYYSNYSLGSKILRYQMNVELFTVRTSRNIPQYRSSVRWKTTSCSYSIRDVPVYFIDARTSTATIAYGFAQLPIPIYNSSGKFSSIYVISCFEYQNESSIRIKFLVI